MKFQEYKEKIKARLSRYFNIEEKYTYNNKEFDLFATSNLRNEKYIASRKLTIYAFESNEYCFLKYYKDFDSKELEEIIEILRTSIKDYVKPHSEHMSSTITGVLVVDELKNYELIKRVKGFHYQKSFAFGFKGWVDIRIILVDLRNRSVITSKKARRVDKFYKP